ncbi:unnamed protein product [Calicophoron daubneyi]|uniref:Uncharacterized protein n=1 Tax=Calicophoron daubneyi TaxID=300641 RepID=A0AAV2TUU7_CALDB
MPDNNKIGAEFNDRIRYGLAHCPYCNPDRLLVSIISQNLEKIVYTMCPNDLITIMVQPTDVLEHPKYTGRRSSRLRDNVQMVPSLLSANWPSVQMVHTRIDRNAEIGQQGTNLLLSDKFSGTQQKVNRMAGSPSDKLRRSDLCYSEKRIGYDGPIYSREKSPSRRGSLESICDIHLENYNSTLRPSLRIGYKEQDTDEELSSYTSNINSLSLYYEEVFHGHEMISQTKTHNNLSAKIRPPEPVGLQLLRLTYAPDAARNAKILTI